MAKKQDKKPAYGFGALAGRHDRIADALAGKEGGGSNRNKKKNKAKKPKTPTKK